MKNKLLTALILLFFISACKKDEDNVDNNTPLPQKSCFINTIVSGTDKTVYTYDAENRVIKVESFEANVLDYYETFTYTNSNVTVKYFEGNGTADGQDVAEMQNGRVTKVVSTDSYTNNGFTETYTSTYVYEYNSAGFLTKSTGESKTTTNKPNTPATTSTETITYTYQNDNLSQKVESYQSGSSSYTSTYSYEYFTDKDNVVNIGYEIGDYDDEYVFLFGKQSKNLIKKVSYVDRDVNSGVTQNYSGSSTYTFDYDANGKPNKVTEVSSNTSNGQTTNRTNIHNLTLNCK